MPAKKILTLDRTSGRTTEYNTVATSAGTANNGDVPALNANGILDSTIVNSTTTSAGVGSSGKVVALNASGLLDTTVVNSTTTSAGVGSSGKVVALNASGLLDTTIVNSTVVSAGASSATKIVALNGSGQLDSTVLPTGIGPATQSITTSEALAAGAFVNIWNSTGAKVRNADNTAAGKEAHGFVLTAFASGVSAIVYFADANTAVTGQTPGPVFLGTVGGAVSTLPTTAGAVQQIIGLSTSATTIMYNYEPPVVLA